MKGQGEIDVSGSIGATDLGDAAGATLDAALGDDNQTHTPQQIEELEKFFKECSLPSETQVLDLAKSLDLDANNIEFWFQNKRNEIMMKEIREEGKALLRERERLLKEKERITELMKSMTCKTCGNNLDVLKFYTEQQLMKENAKLKKEIKDMEEMLNISLQIWVDEYIMKRSPNDAPNLSMEQLYAALITSVPGQKTLEELDFIREPRVKKENDGIAEGDVAVEEEDAKPVGDQTSEVAEPKNLN